MSEVRSYYFTLQSSQEVEATLDEIAKIAQKSLIVYIASFMHNTVLVHNLMASLEKQYPHLTIHQLPNEKAKPTEVLVCPYADLPQNSDENFTREKAMLFQEIRNNMQLKKELAASQNELIKRYFIDSLTQLPNHYQLRQDLGMMETKQTFIVIHIDNFKMINDFYGFIVGDYLLETLTKTLKEHLSTGTLYKTNGADFALLIPEEKDFYQLQAYLKELHEEYKNLNYKYLDNDIYVDLTFASSVNDTWHDIFSKVNMALQYAKDMRLPYWIYEDSMKFKDAYESNLKVSIKIRKAIENSGIVPYFQPIISNKTGKICKYECLARLIDSDGNILPPSHFLPVAKTIKMYFKVTTTIIEKSFEVFKDSEYTFSINLSIEDIMNSEIYTYIMEKLNSSNMGHRVIFELLESEHIEDYNKVSKFINEVRRLGAKVALDDFGSGFSNFSYLSNIRVDYIKIDGSLIEHIDTDTSAEIVVETIVDFAKRLGIETIAEYVHSSTVLAKVKQLGVDYSQGYYIDEPFPALPQN